VYTQPGTFGLVQRRTNAEKRRKDVSDLAAEPENGNIWQIQETATEKWICSLGGITNQLSSQKEPV